ncbi:MAG: NAD-dependent glycerol-3-phosphate dehydrogenase [Candidatus Roseilinea sp.]|nr:MAG: NAD-dependent glycerol-3-phosphate dehydrogenase [Candidatus Roseilinea sp.]
MKIVVLGAGVMGTAFTMPIADAGHTVHLVGTHLDGDIIEEIHETRVHPRLKSRVPDAVTPFPIAGLGEAIQGADLVVLGVNSHGVAWAANVLADVLPPDVPVIMLTKGLYGDGESLHILPAFFRSQLPARSSAVAVMAIGGPCIAGELAARRHSCVVLGGSDVQKLNALAAALRTPYYHVWTSTDLVGLEVCVALKNLYALAVGLVIGLLERDGIAGNGAQMHNLAAAIFAQGLYETDYLVRHLGGDMRSVYTLPGAGDLYVTCQGGRNSRMGRLLGLGMPYAQAKAEHMPNESVEGAMLAEAVGDTVHAMIRAGKLDARKLPLMLAVIDIVCHGAPVEIPWDAFFHDTE